MRNVLLNSWVLVAIATIVCVASLVYSLASHDPQWFGRAGSVVTIVGLLLTIKHGILSGARDDKSIVMERFHYANFAPEESSAEFKQQLAAARHILRDEYLGLLITVIGTAIWGYGDVLLRGAT